MEFMFESFLENLINLNYLSSNNKYGLAGYNVRNFEDLC